MQNQGVSLKCPICNKRSNEPINLRCEHHPCFECASQIITVDQQSTHQIQTKYKLICPVCHKKTMTYDLRHLIISNTQQDQDLYVTTKYINKKPEIIPKRQNCSSRQSHTKTNSNLNQCLTNNINTNGSNRPISIQCKRHVGNNLQYFCEECCKKNNQADVFLCGECVKGYHGKSYGHHSPHNNSHKLTNIRASAEKIFEMNQRNKQQAFSHKYKFLNQTISGLVQKKQRINHQFESLYKDISNQFKTLYNYINEQYESVKRQLKYLYSKQYEQIKINIGLAEKLKESLQQLQKIPTQSYNYNQIQIQAHVHYSLCFFDIQKAIDTNKSKLSQKFQMPKIIKRKTLTIGSHQKLIQIQGQYPINNNACSNINSCVSSNINSNNNSHINININPSKYKENTQPVTPTNTNSARFLNYSLDSSKNPRNQHKQREKDKVQKFLDLNLLKQNNFYPLSPKNYLSSKANV